MFNKQHLGADRGWSVSRRALVLGVVGTVVLQRGLGSARAVQGCGGSPAFTPALAATKRGRSIVDVADYLQLKDPCLVSDGSTWHLYGTGWKVGVSAAVVFHATAETATGPFTMCAPCAIEGVSGRGVAAPGVVFDDGVFHMFLQTEFQALHGTIEHLTSKDGAKFDRVGTALAADASLGEAVIYDAQPCVIGGLRYVAYAAAARVGDTELHLARSSGGWSGPRVRLGPIVRQSEVMFQGLVGCAGFEWGLEGPQLVELPNGQVLLFGVCFLGGRDSGHRQRVFAAVSLGPMGPYRVLGVPFDPQLDTWATGENGHPGAALDGDTIVVVYQGRQVPGRDGPWALRPLKSARQLATGTSLSRCRRAPELSARSRPTSRPWQRWSHVASADDGRARLAHCVCCASATA